MLKLGRIIGKELILSGLLLILFASLSLTTLSKAAVVWSDNFDDGNLDEWTISGAASLNWKASILAKGNFSAADKTMRATGTPVFDAFSFATHPTITTGTWSWDLFYNAEGTINSITMFEFIDKPIMKLPFDWNGYHIGLTNFGGINFARWEDGLKIVSPATMTNFKVHTGSWTHFDVTRDSSGRWRLYVNGTLSMDYVDNKFSNFGYFGFFMQPGPAIDNVVVSDTIYVPPGSLRVTVKDSSGNAVTSAAVTSTKQPSGQTALSGTTTADGTVTFTGLAVGNYTLQVSKSGYVSGSAQGAVASGAKTEVSTTLQAQPSSGIPGFPFASIVIGIFLYTSWYLLYSRKSCAYTARANHND